LKKKIGSKSTVFRKVIKLPKKHSTWKEGDRDSSSSDFKGHGNRQRGWDARDRSSNHPRFFDQDEAISQEADQVSETWQSSDESIVVKDSHRVSVQTTDTQAAVNLQIALQAAIAAVISITIFDSDQAENVTQDLFQSIQVRQANRQRILIEDSENVCVTTTDTDVSVNIQVLLQVLLALVAKLDIL
jgi:spore coat protein X